MNLAILQARMSSSRLPNKVLKQVNNKELLAYECERLLNSKKIDKLVIATSTDKSDDAIVEFAKRENIEVFRGSLDDVLSRYYECATKYKYEQNVDKLNIVRVTGDCPVIDPEVIDDVVEAFENGNYDYTSNTLLPTYPDGMDIEVCTYEALSYAYKNATFKSDREHVTLYIKNSNRFKKFNYKAKVDFSHLRLTVDEQNDFDLIKNILENLYPINKNFTYLDIISYMTKNPYLLLLNSNIKRDEGLDKSLIEDTYDRRLIDQMRFNKWNRLKQNLHQKEKIANFNERDILFMSIGYNIGYEQYGKGKEFLRPVIVIRKFNKHLFLGIPLTSKTKEGKFFYEVKFHNKKHTALLLQTRTFDIKRFKYRLATLGTKEFKKLKSRFEKIVNSNSKEPESD